MKQQINTILSHMNTNIINDFANKLIISKLLCGHTHRIRKLIIIELFVFHHILPKYRQLYINIL